MPSRRLELVPPDELKAALADGVRAQHEAGDLQASRDSFERAYRLAEQAGDAESMALAALGLAGLWVAERRTVTSTVLLEARLQHVLALLDPRSALALRVRTRLAGEADYARGTHAAVLAALDEVRAQQADAAGAPLAGAAGAAGGGDPELLAEALRIAHHCLLGPEHVSARRELAVELTKASFRTERRSDLLMGLLWQTADAYCAGDPHAGRLLGELKDHLAQRDHLAVGFVASAIDVMLAIRAGRFADAEALAAVCASRGAAAGDADHAWWSGAQLVTIRWYQGRLTELLPMLDDRVHSPVLSAVDNSAVAALAVAAALSGDRHQGRQRAGRAVRQRPGRAAQVEQLAGHDERRGGGGVPARGARRGGPGLRAAPPARAPADDRQPRRHLLRVGAARPGRGRAHLAAAGPGRRAPDRGRPAEPRAGALARAGGVPAAAGPGARAARLARRRRHGAPRARRGHGRGGLDGPAGARLPGAPVAGQAPAVAAEAHCQRAGRKWRLTLRNRSVLVEDSIGMVHLAVLIANPRQEIQAADLVAGLAGLSGTRARGRGGAARP